MSGIKSTHPEYENNLKRWKKVRDVVAGEDAVKAGDYLKVSQDKNVEMYKENAWFVGYTSTTLDWLEGCVFRKPPKINLPSNLEYLVSTDQEHLSLSQISRQVLKEIGQTGRVGLLIDAPKTPEKITLAEQMSGKYVPRISVYPAESIRMWRDRSNLIMLEEKYYATKPDGYALEDKTQYRELGLDSDGYYYQRVFKDDKEVEYIEPRNSKGQRLNYIPFVFIGSDTNSASCDKALLYDIACVNINHYINSAQHENMLYLLGSPTTFITTSLDPDELRIANENRQITMGSSYAYVLGDTGDAKLLETSDKTSLKTAMDDKVAHMLGLGAKIVQSSVHNTTAEEMYQKHKAEISKLDKVVNNINDGMNLALQYISDFSGEAVEEGAFKLNDDYYDRKVDPQLLLTQIQLLQNGVLSKNIIRNYLRGFGVIPENMDNETIDAELSHDIGGFSLE